MSIGALVKGAKIHKAKSYSIFFIELFFFSPCSLSVVAHIDTKHPEWSLARKSSYSDVSQEIQKGKKSADVPKESTDGKLIKCPLCNATYQHKKSLVKHMMREHQIDKDDKRIKSLPPPPKVSEYIGFFTNHFVDNSFVILLVDIRVAQERNRNECCGQTN